MPFTHVNLRGNVMDVAGNFDGPQGLEFRLATKARFPYGHTHAEQEELFVVVGGSGRMKLDDDIINVAEWDAVRVPPGTWRAYEAGPDADLELLVIGAPNLGHNPRDDVTGQRDWWAD
jgi:mannose-6-phosphate isomerase-like protein (cupin superfamily)